MMGASKYLPFCFGGGFVIGVVLGLLARAVGW